MTPIVTRRAAFSGTLEQALTHALHTDVVWLDSAIGDGGLGRRSLLCLQLQTAFEVHNDVAQYWSADGEPRETAAADTGLWALADVCFAAESQASGGALGWVGYVAYEAGVLADPGLPNTAHALPFPILRFDRVRAALVSEEGRTELVVSASSDPEADALLSHWASRLAQCGEPPNAPQDATLRAYEPPDAALHQGNVAAIREAIAAGDVYQACYTFPLRFERPASLAPAYLRLRANSPGDFGAYLKLGRLEAASTSPERFLRIDGRDVVCRPMKGTRPRDPDADRDAALANELRQSEKDRAENVMIVDLMRNDLGRVCTLGSVHVPELYAVEHYATVHQMTSTVAGELRADVGPFRVLQAVFPPGSMTGAPKVSACHLLASLEVEPRGLYSGTIGWLGFDGTCEFSVVIRTLQAWNEIARWNVGGGVVWDSTPEGEYEEALSKAAALQRAALAVLPFGCAPGKLAQDD